MVEVEGIAPTRSILQGLAVPMTVTPNCCRQRSCTRIFDVRSVALWILLSYSSVKVDSCVGLAPTNDRVAAGRFGFFSLQEENAAPW
jgi:hypothetical protein